MQTYPSSVYRLQLSPNFSLKNATSLIPYLKTLGIDALYCSPVFSSFSCGYDVINPNEINSKLGSHQQFIEFCQELQKNNIQHILDLVPNHMSIKGRQNLWWLDVLKHGPKSPFIHFFDLHPEEKILLPILDTSYEEALQEKKIKLCWQEGLYFIYHDYFLPVNTPRPTDIQSALTRFNNDPILLKELMDKQFYQLSSWKEAGKKINYRRFFNIEYLIGICMEKKTVFDTYHQLLFSLIEASLIDGLRIDHPDGLYEPDEYFKRLQQKKPGLIWIEKILSPKENLPSTWPVDGTVGYEFLNVLSGVFIKQKNQKKITDIYHNFIKKPIVFDDLVYERKKNYLLTQMVNDLHYLVSLLPTCSQTFSKTEIQNACLEIMACFPVYRTYITPSKKIRSEDRIHLKKAVTAAIQRNPDKERNLFSWLEHLLLTPCLFTLHFQQYTAAVMAKGLEDSTFYIYNRLISLNEVGHRPDQFGFSKKNFHAFNKKKLAKWPLGLLPSSTHDTKYSADARLKLHVLSEMPEKWAKTLQILTEEYTQYKTDLMPDKNTEYFLYQMILLLHPAEPQRLWIALLKAIREAGTHTSWLAINAPYEEAVKKFLFSILQNPSKAFLTLEKEISEYGFWNSLSALTLKIGSCGIFDLYQGDELIYYSLVDPDNRRAVNFLERENLLEEGLNLKMLLTTKGLHCRKKHKELFVYGNYLPLKSPPSVIAFLRKWENQTAFIVVRRFFSKIPKKTPLKLPPELQNKTMLNIFTEKKFLMKDSMALDELFTPYPFAIFLTQT